MISTIVCVDKNWGIGHQGKLLVNIPEDIRFFRDKTKNSIVIMGRKTYDSLPSKPLKNRANVVITSKIDKDFEITDNGAIFMSMDFVKKLLVIAKSAHSIDCYVIGGGRIYEELLPYCDKAYITKVDYAYENADTYFPNIDKNEEWEIEESSESKIYNGIKYRFCTYKKEV